jgi:hypothetical protein
VSLIGSVTVFQDVANTPDEDEVAACYLKRHPDAVHWLPKDKHQPHIVSLVLRQLFLRLSFTATNVADHHTLGILGEV